MRLLSDIARSWFSPPVVTGEDRTYAAMFDGTSDALIVYDLDAGRCIDVNVPMLNLYGLASKEEALACSAAELSANEPPYTEAEGKRHLQRAIENGLEVYEWRARKKTGELFWVEIATRCFDINGRRRLIASIRDISERKRTEEELRRSQDRLEAAQTHARIGSFELQPDLAGATWSPQMFRLFNLDPSSGPPAPGEFLELVHPADRDAVRQAFERAPSSADLVSVEYRTSPDRGPVRVFSMNIVAHQDAAGRLRHAAGTVQDITERREMEEALRSSEERFRSLVEYAPDAILVQREGRLIYVNPAMLKLMGASRPEELLGKHFVEYVAPEFHDAVRKRIQRLGQNREPLPFFELVFLRLDGSRVPVESTVVSVSLEGKEAQLALIRDIGERKRVETELNQERGFIQTLVRSSPAYLVATAIDGTILMMNESMLSALGYTTEEVVGRNYVTTCVPEREHAVFTTTHQRVGTSNLVSHSEGTVLTKDGRELLVEWHGRRVCRDGVRDYVLGVGIDITERRQAEIRIRQQAALLAASHDSILVWEPSSGIQYMNPAAEEMTGRRFSQAQAQDLFAVLRPQAEQELRAAIQAVDAHDRWSGELTLLTTDDKVRTVASRWTALEKAEGKSPAVLITCNDITEQKRLESQYLRIQRLDSIGTLASGIAHDLNNVLSPILMGLELLLPQTPEEDTRVVLTMMKDSAQRGVDTVKQLLTFARGSDSKKGPVQPRHLLKEITRLLQQTFPKNIQIHTSYSGTPAAVLADVSQLHQVLMNLCINARDAMPEGGALSVTLENVVLDEAGARTHPKARPIPYVVFKVSDSGMGIPPAIVDRIFDPFFTTKPQGKGTGLGLATVLGIVENHSGFVTVESQVGRGTTFQVFLPAVVSAEPPASETSAKTLSPGRGELVVVVDDEPAILHLAGQVLQHGGYATLLATNASEALHLCRERRDHVRAVLTDIMMPFGDGRQLIDMLQQEDPALPIIAMSGLATSEFKQETLRRGARAFVRKPFGAEELLHLLRDVLCESQLNPAERPSIVRT